MQLRFLYVINFVIKGAAKIPLVLYATQLVLNWAWPPLFFKFHLLKWVSTNLNILDNYYTENVFK